MTPRQKDEEECNCPWDNCQCCKFWESKIEELEEKNLELTKALDTAHKIFGSESDKLGEMVHKLEAKLEKAIGVLKNMMKCDPALLNNSLGSSYAIKHYVEARETLKEIEEGK